MRSKQIIINRTRGEWERLNIIAKEEGKAEFKDLLRNQIWKLAREINACSKCVSEADGDIVEKKYYISQETARSLEIISIKMKKPIGAVINDIIISRLLHNRKSPS